MKITDEFDIIFRMLLLQNFQLLITEINQNSFEWIIRDDYNHNLRLFGDETH